MFLSIIIPVYNCEKYLAECLDSCLNQDIDSNDYEILCINDGSTDQSAEILNVYAKKFDNIRVFEQENKGVSVARNLGLDNSFGDYVMFVDGDDIIRNNVLLKLKKLIINSKSQSIEFGAFMGSTEAIRAQGNKQSKSNLPCEMMWTHIFSRNIIEKYHIRFIAGITFSEDLLFLKDFTNFCDKSIKTDEVIYFYRTHSGSASDYKDIENIKKICNSYILLFSILKGRINDSIYKKSITFDLWRRFHRRYYRLVSVLPYNYRRELYHNLKNSRPYLIPEKNCFDKKEVSFYRKIKRKTYVKRISVTFFATRIGAHIAYLIRKLSDTKLFYCLKHPKRFLKHPIKSLKS